MKASEAVKMADKVLREMSCYVYTAQRWEMMEEDDIDELRDSLIDILAGAEDET